IPDLIGGFLGFHDRSPTGSQVTLKRLAMRPHLVQMINRRAFLLESHHLIERGAELPLGEGLLIKRCLPGAHRPAKGFNRRLLLALAQRPHGLQREGKRLHELPFAGGSTIFFGAVAEALSSNVVPRAAQLSSNGKPSCTAWRRKRLSGSRSRIASSMAALLPAG